MLGDHDQAQKLIGMNISIRHGAIELRCVRTGETEQTRVLRPIMSALSGSWNVGLTSATERCPPEG